MATSEKLTPIYPRIIIHGGAGNIKRANLSQDQYEVYREALLSILHRAYSVLSKPGADAIDVATYAVCLFEDNPFFNCGHGAVFTRAGTNELEASIMVSRGKRKRGVGVMKVTRVKHPIKLAREMLLRGERDDGGGAQGHCQLEGETCDGLAKKWGLEMVKPSYFFTRKRWDEHRCGLGLEHDDETYERDRRSADGIKDSNEDLIMNSFSASDMETDPTWDGKQYLPQGTVGCVVLDSSGTLCVATSTGGLTNKLPGRIGDTPTIGSGFYSEEWRSSLSSTRSIGSQSSPLETLLGDCLPGLTSMLSPAQSTKPIISTLRAAAVSGTGNGDSFLRIAAARTACAISRFSTPHVSFQQAVSTVAGPGGMLQQSAEDRWEKTGEGEGGMIGIELIEGDGRGEGKIVADFNCGGMFRAWIDDVGKARAMVFRGQTY